MIENPHLFWYLGIGIILLALIFLPVTVRVVIEPEVGETELWHIGPIFALLIGVWSLPSLLLGVIDSGKFGKVALMQFTLVSCIANIVLVGAIWDGIRFWRHMPIQWLINYGPFLVSSIIVDGIILFYLIKRRKLAESLKNRKIRIALLMTLTFIPLMLAFAVAYMWLAVLL